MKQVVLRDLGLLYKWENGVFQRRDFICLWLNIELVEVWFGIWVFRFLVIVVIVRKGDWGGSRVLKIDSVKVGLLVVFLI